MTMKTIWSLVALSWTATLLHGQESAYLQDRNGLLYGPYAFKTGETIQVGGSVATIVIPAKRKLDLQRKLEETIITRIDFKQRTLREVVQYIQEASGTNVPDRLPQGKVPIALDLSGYIAPVDDDRGPFAPPASEPEVPPLITLSARFLSVLDAIKIVAEMTALDFELRNDTVYLYPRYRKRVQQPAAAAGIPSPEP